MKKRSFLFLFLFVCALLQAQSDTSLMLRPEKLKEKDIISRDVTLKQTKIISGTRNLDDLDMSPFTVWVITADDILRYGFVTLGDVLRAAPGIRVSQPGNAMEGETFMMRGLQGNESVKILINDIPVKPSIAAGMPIGAQLPIRQAERIEVMYGPAGAIYGNEACAGVVNIILKETERPLFTQADISFGNFGYNSLDLMLGGKLGKDKKIFRFSLYGSSTVRDRTDVYDDATYTHEPSNYLPYGLDTAFYYGNRNYYPDEANGLFPKLTPIPHESRLFGLNLKWRGMRFTYHRMERHDHTALGLNPVAISWANPSNRLSERLESFTLDFQRQRKKRQTFTNISALRYKIDATSTSTYLFDNLSASYYHILEAALPTPNQKEKLLQQTFEKFSSGQRYAAANGLDLRVESRMNIALRSKLYFDAGMSLSFSLGYPLQTHYFFPVDFAYNGLTSINANRPYDVFGEIHGSSTGFAQLQWRSRKLNIIAGGSSSATSQANQVALAPRIAALYKIDSAFTVRANFSSGFRAPSLYAYAHSYYYYPNGDISRTSFYDNLDEENEKFYNSELAVVYNRKNARLEGIFFHQKAYNIFRPGYTALITNEFGDDYWYYGYKNAPGLALSVWGLQGLLTMEQRDILTLRSGKKESELTWKGEFFAQYCRGKEFFGDPFPNTSDIRNMPRWMTQFRSSWRAGKFQMMVASNRQKNSLSGAVIYKDLYQRAVTLDKYPVFRTWDISGRFNLSNHFLVYFHILNVFNRQAIGIDATGTPDDLLYNPQPGRVFRFGVNYNMN